MEVNGLLQFIDKSPTCYHAVANIQNALNEAGFVALFEGELPKDASQNKFYYVRNDSSILAFQIPQGMPKGFHIMASHSDAPCFKLKTKPEIAVDEAYVKLNVEKYGGMILSAWLDRPLGIAGRAIVKKDDELVSMLVDLGGDACVIPNLAIHFNREINKGFEYNPQTDMLPLVSGDKACRITAHMAEQLAVEEDAILGSDLFLYSGEKGWRIGLEGEFLLAPRLDDLQCVYTTLQGFIKSEPREYIPVYAVFNNEEVGSRTGQGADSDFLASVCKDVWDYVCNRNRSDGAEPVPYRMAVKNSFLISADNAHALHPNHPEKSDVTNKPYLNGGIVVKQAGNAQYTSDGYSMAYLQDVCNGCGLTLQTFANRSDMPGGSTLGNVLMSHLSMPSADIGLPQLAMHSAMETAGAKDGEDMIGLSAYFYGM